MRKNLPFLFAFLLILSACNKNVNVEDVKNNVQLHYNSISDFVCSFDALTSLNDKAQEFSINMQYNSLNDDVITIVKPFELAGISANIAKNDDNLMISFDEFQVETFMANNLGISPVDVTSFAIDDLKNREPYAIFVGDYIKLSYQNQEISKDIYLNRETYDIMKIEVYASREMVISCDYY